MSDESAAAIRDTRKDFMTEHRIAPAERKVTDISIVGGRRFATHCLIKYVGRKSGKTFITPLCYADIGGEVVIVGSKGGGPRLN